MSIEVPEMKFLRKAYPLLQAEPCTSWDAWGYDARLVAGRQKMMSYPSSVLSLRAVPWVVKKIQLKSLEI